MNARIPPDFVLLACGILIWLPARYLVGFSFSFSGQGLFAGIAIVAGLGIIFWANGTLTRHRTTGHPGRHTLAEATCLVTDGPYRFSRNPIYLGMVMLLIGWLLLWSNWLGIVIIAAFMLFITKFQIIAEEKALESVFHSAYLAYKSRVRRWV